MYCLSDALASLGRDGYAEIAAILRLAKKVLRP